MRGLEQTGVVAWIDARAATLAGGSGVWGQATTVSGVMVILSNLISNVPAVLAERAEAREVRIGFAEYARVGIPVTLLTLAWGVGVLVTLG